MATSLPSLLGMSRDEMSELVRQLGEPAYRGRQLFGATFAGRATTLAEMSDLPRALRTKLEERATLARPRLDALQVSADGTRKYGFRGEDQVPFEAVYIPEVARGRATNSLCVSSQTGCALGCAFCFTASLKELRNLTAAEIVGQVLAVGDELRALGDAAAVTNIVFMGMGEPLLNYDEVVRALHLLTDPAGLDFSPRRLTVSTAGIVPRIRDLGRELPVQLAISLNATTDSVRNQIMPVNRKWPLRELVAALKAYPLPPRRRFTIEYVLLDGINDSLEDAKRLPKLLQGLPVKVNLLPLNAHERTVYRPPAARRVLEFQAQLTKAGILALIRSPRGTEIAAACGQLGGALAGDRESPRP